MKNARTLAIAAVGALVLSVVWTVLGNIGNSRNGDTILQGRVNKESYVQGEPVRAYFKFVNVGHSTISVPSGGVDVGSLKIFIADAEGGSYKEYKGAGWGRKRGRQLDLGPGQAHEYSEVTILWNGKAELTNFSESELNEALRGRIATEYAFQEPGVYFIKGRSYVGPDFQPIESEPIRIEIRKPEGSDLVVWNRIKGNREIAHLLQHGAFDAEDETKKQALIAEIEQILSNFPDGVYSNYLRLNLEKYKADEVRRKETLEKATIRKNDL